MTDDVARYYDENTHAFLARGQGGGEGVLHRAVWGEGVRSRTEAFHFVHGLLLKELVALGRPKPRILDLGCGVGATLLYLVERVEGVSFGMTNSEAQLEFARSLGKATFEKGDFCVDPLPTAIDFAYGIESFVHAKDASAFLGNVAKSLRSGGRLVLVDDFLAAGSRDEIRIQEFVKGWHARSLLRPEEVDARAAVQRLELVSDRDLTKDLELDRPRDWAIAALIPLLRPLLRPLGLESQRYLSLLGGNALRECLKRGFVTYRFRVYEKHAVE